MTVAPVVSVVSVMPRVPAVTVVLVVTVVAGDLLQSVSVAHRHWFRNLIDSSSVSFQYRCLIGIRNLGGLKLLLVLFWLGYFFGCLRVPK